MRAPVARTMEWPRRIILSCPWAMRHRSSESTVKSSASVATACRYSFSACSLVTPGRFFFSCFSLPAAIFRSSRPSKSTRDERPHPSMSMASMRPNSDARLFQFDSQRPTPAPNPCSSTRGGSGVEEEEEAAEAAAAAAADSRAGFLMVSVLMYHGSAWSLASASGLTSTSRLSCGKRIWLKVRCSAAYSCSGEVGIQTLRTRDQNVRAGGVNAAEAAEAPVAVVAAGGGGASPSLAKIDSEKVTAPPAAAVAASVDMKAN